MKSRSSIKPFGATVYEYVQTDTQIKLKRMHFLVPRHFIKLCINDIWHRAHYYPHGTTVYVMSPLLYLYFNPLINREDSKAKRHSFFFSIVLSVSYMYIYLVASLSSLPLAPNVVYMLLHPRCIICCLIVLSESHRRVKVSSLGEREREIPIF